MRKIYEIRRCRNSVSWFSIGRDHSISLQKTDIPHFTSFSLDGECLSFWENINKNLDMEEENFEKKLSDENESQV